MSLKRGHELNNFQIELNDGRYQNKSYVILNGLRVHRHRPKSRQSLPIGLRILRIFVSDHEPGLEPGGGPGFGPGRGSVCEPDGGPSYALQHGLWTRPCVKTGSEPLAGPMARPWAEPWVVS